MVRRNVVCAQTLATRRDNLPGADLGRPDVRKRAEVVVQDRQIGAVCRTRRAWREAAALCWGTLLLLAPASLGCVDITPPWEKPTARAGGSTGGLSDYGGRGGAGGQFGGNSGGPNTVIGGNLGADAGSEAEHSQPAGSGPNDSGHVTPTGGIGGAIASAGGTRSTVVASSGATSGAGGTVARSGGVGVTVVRSSGASGTVAATGGSGGVGLSSGGSRGGSITTGGRGGTTGAKSSSSSTSQCAGGVVDSSICWVLGASGASCEQTCAASGGTSPDAPKHVGTAAQGGSLSECTRLFRLLGHTGTVYSQSLGRGLGCHWWTQAPFPYAWISSPDYSDTASHTNVHIVCGCRLLGLAGDT
jgi:hypothetical protein